MSNRGSKNNVDGPTVVLPRDGECVNLENNANNEARFENFENNFNGVTSILFADGSQESIQSCVETEDNIANCMEHNRKILSFEDGTKADITNIINQKANMSYAIFHVGFKGDHQVYWEASASDRDSMITDIEGIAFVKEAGWIYPRTFFDVAFSMQGIGGQMYATDVVGICPCPGNNQRVRVGFCKTKVTTVQQVFYVYDSNAVINHLH